MNTYCTQAASTMATKPSQPAASLSFTMPFQPSLLDDKSIQSAIDYTTRIIETKLKNCYSDEGVKNMLGRVKQLFSRLNFDTRRKSIAVIISADSEKVHYLNFPVKLFVSTGNFISILDLVAGIKQEIGFYLLYMCEGNIRLYEYYNKHLNKVYEQKPDAVSKCVVDANSRVSSIITYMNRNYQKPVFIVGSGEDVKSFRGAVSYPEIIFPILKPPVQYSAETAPLIVTEIVEQWNCWLSKFYVGRITLAEKNNALVFHYEKVLKALCNSADGLLLMDKRLKQHLQKPATGDIHFQDSKLFISQIQKFVDRGNCIGIKEIGLLGDWGGIVLLPDMMSRHHNTLSFGGYRFPPRPGYLL